MAEKTFAIGSCHMGGAARGLSIVFDDVTGDLLELRSHGESRGLLDMTVKVANAPRADIRNFDLTKINKTVLNLRSAKLKMKQKRDAGGNPFFGIPDDLYISVSWR